MVRENKGFSLIELVIVIAIFLILIIFGLPRFLQFLEIVRFRIAGISLIQNYKRCRAFPESTPIIPFIKGVSFSYKTCNDTMSAAIDEKCSLEIDLTSGEKKRWPNSYKECSNQSLVLKENLVAVKTIEEDNKEAKKTSILPRDSNGEIVFSQHVVGTAAVRMDCQADFGRVETLKKQGDHWNDRPKILLSDSNAYSKKHWPNGKKYKKLRPDCLGVEVPASAFVDGILPKPFEIKEAYRLKGVSSRDMEKVPVKIKNFDEYGRPLMLISPDEHEVDQEAWRIYMSERNSWEPERNPLDRKRFMKYVRAMNPEFDWEKVTKGVE